MERYAVLAARIRRELADLQRVVTRVQRAFKAARERPEDQDLYLDSAALNLHDFYAGLERIFHQIASNMDRNVPTGHGSHRDLLRQMNTALPQLRPQVLSEEAVKSLDEYLRFRHVVRSIYSFQFDPERIERLVKRLPETFDQARQELEEFAGFLEELR